MKDTHQALQRVLQSDNNIISAMTAPSQEELYRPRQANITLVMTALIGSHLELGDHSDFTEPLGSWVLSFLVSEDLVKKGVVRLLKEVDELWWHWVLKQTKKIQ